jgi:hypothetical protein
MSTLTSLFLVPADPLAIPSYSLVIELVRTLKIIDRALEDGVYTAGEGFSRHVVFAGCSPYLVMQPPADGGRQFCHVAVHGPFDQPQLLTGPNTVKPRCPGCRARFSNWKDQLASWRSPGALAHCDSCASEYPPYALDWRGHAAAGRMLVEMRNVFPGEASPSDTLMQELHSTTGMAWRYAWAAYFD